MSLTFDLVRGGGLTVATEYIEFQLTTTPEIVALDNDGVTYVKIPNMVAGLKTAGFDVVTDSVVYQGTPGTFVINGTSDLDANKAIEVSYALFINDTLIPGEITSHTFTASSKLENISITSIANLATGDILDIRAKSDGTASSSITVNKLDLTLVRL
ncbi:MAG: hypothetical protein QQN63_00055 [Nitrosopumilus sp.]